MSTKTWHHISPVTGLGICQAQSPDKCKFGAGNHFSAKAAERIEDGRPANYAEHEAMREHQKVTGQKIAEKMVAAPKPSPPKPTPIAKPVAPASPRQTNGFPTSHRRPQVGDEILYHSDIGLPKNFRPPSGKYDLQYSRHAEEASLDDRYGKIPKLKRIDTDRMKIIEVGVQEGRVSKILYRGTLPCMECHQAGTHQAKCPHDKRDMCVVVIPKANSQPWYVKTVWINLQSDKHRTLDEKKYATP